jgi:hypothetical protein
MISCNLSDHQKRVFYDLPKAGNCLIMEFRPRVIPVTFNADFWLSFCQSNPDNKSSHDFHHESISSGFLAILRTHEDCATGGVE